MTDKERFNYYVTIGHHMERHLHNAVRLINKNINRLNYHCGMDWRNIIKDETHPNGNKFLGYDMMGFTFTNQVIDQCEYGDSLSQLNMLITNFVKHSGKYFHKSSGENKDYMETDAALEIGFFFPGFLSKLNEMFIQDLCIHDLLD